MCRVGLAVPGALHARHFHPTSSPRASPPPRRPPGSTALRGAAGPGLRDLRQSGRRHHRVSDRRLVDEAPASGLGRARRRDRGLARPRRVHRARDRARRRARALRRVRRRARPRPAAGAAREPRSRVGAGRADVQAVPVRLDRPALHGLRAAAARAASRATRGGGLDPVPHRRRSGPAPVGAARLQARAAQRLRGEVQPALPARVDPRARPGRAGGVRRRRRARRGGAEHGGAR